VSSEEERRGGSDRRGGSERRGDSEHRKKTPDRRSGANRRSEIRTKKRIRCEVTDGSVQQRGFVLDVSLKGLFVQTPKPIDPGREIEVELSPPGREAIQLRANVARSRRVPASLASVAAPGVGLRITMASPEWYEFVADVTSSEPLTRSASSPKPGSSQQQADTKQPAAPEKPVAKKKRKRKLPPRMAPPQTRSRYRVKAKQTGGSRSRSLDVSATSREDAETQAIEQLGNDWKVIDVEGA
jgi:hypothetical protein